MSLYYEGAKAFDAFSSKKSGSLKSIIYQDPSLKSPTTNLYRVVTESLKFKEILREVIDNSGILKLEKKLTPTLTILLLHDHLIGRGIALPANHPLKASVLKHKARLSAELTRSRIRRGFPTLEALVKSIKAKSEPQKPRWIRVNTLKTNMEAMKSSFLEGFTKIDKVEDLLDASSDPKRYLIDTHIPNLIGLPSSFPTSRITGHKLYQNGSIIIQDKASCMPAALLSPPEGSTCIDACAAPGNKTTHLAALAGKKSTIVAYERDKARGKVLKQMVDKSGALGFVEVRVDDFLASAPERDPVLREATHIILDPSCSGSGIVSRFENEPDAPDESSGSAKSGNRKRPHAELEEEEAEEMTGKDELSARLQQLSTFQKHILTHALAFPSAERITYSTCSVHAEENELVVLHALQSDVAKARGWKLLKRKDQGLLRDWNRRGTTEALNSSSISEKEKKTIADSCIRCDHNGGEGTIGFFVACFVRQGEETTTDHDVDMAAATEEAPIAPAEPAKKNKKKKKKAKRQKTE